MRTFSTKPGSAKKLSVGVVGPGLIGKTVLKQLHTQKTYLKVCGRPRLSVLLHRDRNLFGRLHSPRCQVFLSAPYLLSETTTTRHKPVS